MKKFIFFSLYEAWAISSYFFIQSRAPKILDQPFGIVLWVGALIAPIVVLLIQTALKSTLSKFVRILAVLVAAALVIAFGISCAYSLLQMFPLQISVFGFPIYP